MRLSFKRLSVFALAAALLGGASGARAESLSFATFGSFSAGNGSSDVSGGFALLAGSHGSTVTATFMPAVGFFAIPALPTPGAAARIAIGALSIVPYDFDGSAPIAFSTGDRFNLAIKSLSPYATGLAALSASIDGSLSYTPSSSPVAGTDSGSFTFDFGSGNSAIVTTLDGRRFAYSLENVTVDVDTSLSRFGTRPSSGTLYLDVSELPTSGPNASPTPLPRSATMGLMLLATLGGASLLIRRREIAAAAVR